MKSAVGSFGSLFFYCALMFNFSIFLYQIVNEKQLNLRLGMRMVGLSDIGNEKFPRNFLISQLIG
jgi:hypothetical protein